jgi:hypothetical protein
MRLICEEEESFGFSSWEDFELKVVKVHFEVMSIFEVRNGLKL